MRGHGCLSQLHPLFAQKATCEQPRLSFILEPGKAFISASPDALKKAFPGGNVSNEVWKVLDTGGCRGSTRLEGTESRNGCRAAFGMTRVAEVRPGLRVLKKRCACYMASANMSISAWVANSRHASAPGAISTVSSF